MARKPRGHLSAGSYHVTLRTAGPIAMFLDDTDRYDFCGRFADTIERYKWTCRAFCLMTTHYHLLLDIDVNALQLGMQRINGQYAQEFNRRHGRSGHLHGDRYSATPIESDAHMLRAYRYVIRNPVRAGLCAGPADWRWSSYRGSAGFDSGFMFVTDEPMYSYFGSSREAAIAELRAFCEDS